MPKRFVLFQIVSILLAVCGVYGLLYLTGIIHMPFSLFASSYLSCMLVIVAFVLVFKFTR